MIGDDLGDHDEFVAPSSASFGEKLQTTNQSIDQRISFGLIVYQRTL